MLIDIPKKDDVSLYISRRKELVSFIKKERSIEKGAILLFANFENDSRLFRQDGTFFYLTGIQEPGAALFVDLIGESTLYAPQQKDSREKWVDVKVPLKKENKQELGVDKVALLGDESPGYSFYPFFKEEQYKNLIEEIQHIMLVGGKLCVLSPDSSDEYVEQRLVLERLKKIIPGLEKHIVDISDLVAQMRRKKDMHEIEKLYEAIGVTTMAHEAAAQAIESDVTEKEVQGTLEYIFTASSAHAAFPSVVASGKNGTILHYTTNRSTLKNGDLVIVDIGAQVDGYCADLTRTYPVSGSFTKRQKELYNIVLETQNYIADIACPGMWLRNKKEPDKSLHHLAEKFLESKGLKKYFVHGIGHFLGLDVHDVGNHQRPLQEGDVFTIEPGVYIPEESIGIRIEDNYWMVKDGLVCLSEELPKDPDAIESFMKDRPDESPSDLSISDDDFIEN